MEILSGSCRLGLWHVHVHWKDNLVYRIRFAGLPLHGSVPVPIRRYCAGQKVDLTRFDSIAVDVDAPYCKIYRLVRQVPFGSTVTYGEIARQAGTSARVVGQAMARNPTPLVVPCHRVVGADGIGGFSPDIAIKEMLLVLEKKSSRKKTGLILQ